MNIFFFKCKIQINQWFLKIGITEFGSWVVDRLRAVVVPIVDQNECNQIYEKNITEITSRMICAGYPEGGKDSCKMDSGM